MEEREESEELKEMERVQKMEEEIEEDQDIIEGGEDLPLPPIAEVEVRHAKAMLERAGDLPLDVARTILAAHFRTLRATGSAGIQRLTGGFIQCPSCSTPWMADLFRPRLHGCPRNLRGLRNIARRSRTRPGKLTKKEKSLMYRFQDRRNVISVSCLVCRHRKEELFPIPERQKKVVEEEEEEDVEVERSKKKKRRKKHKEMNAGLLLSSPAAINVTKETDGSPSLSLFSTSMDIETSTLDNPENTLEQKVTPAHSHSKPRQPRAKVVIGSVAKLPASASAPAHVTGVVKEKKKVVSNLKKAMNRDCAKSDVCNGGGKSKNSLSAFLDSLF